MKSRFKSIAIYSSINSKRVSQIALHVEEVLEGLGINRIIPKSSKIPYSKKINFSKWGTFSDKSSFLGSHDKSLLILGVVPKDTLKKFKD